MMSRLETKTGAEMTTVLSANELPPIANSELWREPMEADEPKDIDAGCLVWWLKITPFMARDALKRWNIHNRPESPARVEMYAGDMRTGAWLERNGATIIFAAEGWLLDGQTRLTAIANSGRSQWCLVVTGASTKAQETMDDGRKRTFANALHLRGEKSTKELAAGCSYLYYYEVMATFRTVTPQPSKHQLIEILERYPDLREGLVPGRHLRGAFRCLPVGIAAPLATLLVRADRADAQVFLARLSDGLGISADDDPIFALRRQLTTESQTTVRRTPTWHKAAITIKAFNFWRRGDAVKLLRYNAGGAAREDFPLIEGLDLATGHPQPDILHPRHHEMV